MGALQSATLEICPFGTTETVVKVFGRSEVHWANAAIRYGLRQKPEMNRQRKQFHLTRAESGGVQPQIRREIPNGRVVERSQRNLARDSAIANQMAESGVVVQVELATG